MDTAIFDVCIIINNNNNSICYILLMWTRFLFVDLFVDLSYSLFLVFTALLNDNI